MHAQLQHAEGRAQALEQQLRDLEAAHAALQAQQSDTKALHDARDTAERELARAQRTCKEEASAKAALEARVARLEEREKATAAELQSKTSELLAAQKAVQAAEAEAKRLHSVQNKTIVEHVHVLEEAKKYTDRQLSDVQGELQELASYTKSLERMRARLQQDNEQLTRLANAPPERDETAVQERDEARAELRKVKQHADLTLRQTRAEYETRIKKLEEEMRAAHRASASLQTERTVSELRSERRMSTAARKVLEELRMENERLERDLAAKASVLKQR